MSQRTGMKLNLGKIISYFILSEFQKISTLGDKSEQIKKIECSNIERDLGVLVYEDYAVQTKNTHLVGDIRKLELLQRQIIKTLKNVFKNILANLKDFAV